MAVFQRTFSVSLQCRGSPTTWGSPGAVTWPLAQGPRNSGHSTGAAAGTRQYRVRAPSRLKKQKRRRANMHKAVAVRDIAAECGPPVKVSMAMDFVPARDD